MSNLVMMITTWNKWRECSSNWVRWDCGAACSLEQPCEQRSHRSWKDDCHISSPPIQYATAMATNQSPTMRSTWCIWRQKDFALVLWSYHDFPGFRMQQKILILHNSSFSRPLNGHNSIVWLTQQAPPTQTLGSWRSRWPVTGPQTLWETTRKV